MVKQPRHERKGFTRREFLLVALTGTVCALNGPAVLRTWRARKLSAETFVGRVCDYSADIAGTLKSGFQALGVSPMEIRDKRILLKPNLVETYPGADHITTHPLVIRGAAEAFMAYGAAEVLVGEGPGHCRDSLYLVEESGLAEVLNEDRLRFVDLNDDEIYHVPNSSGNSRLKSLALPNTLRRVDWIVSVAKMKTHHWTGVTLSLKNLFGVMPGRIYGWPKNVLHWTGINGAILDICAALRPDMAIVDGVVGMEGDGPIMGIPREAGVLIMGRNLPAVDATSARVMGINPHKVAHLAAANGRLGSIRAANIQQRGETIASVRTDFALVDRIPAFKRIRL